MDVLMPDGTLVKDVPEGITKAQLQAKLSSSSAPTQTTLQPDVPLVASQMPKQVPVAEPQRSMMDYVKALGEVPATLATGVIAQPVGAAYGVYKGITSPQYGTQVGVEEARQAAAELAQKLQYQPTSPVTQDVLQGIGSAMEAAKVPVTPSGIGQIPSFAQATRNVAQFAKPAIQETLPSVKPVVNTIAQALRKETPAMSGVGAAEVPEVVNRVQMAKQLRVPVELSKGQALRDLGQQKFEIETPKNFPELGKALIESQAKRNDAILQNFDAFVDATGKETYGLRETGRVVDKALVNAANKAKADINTAYTAAREAGETQQPISYTPLTTYINEQSPTVRSKLAPVIDIVNEQIIKNDPKKTGQISINNLEDIYQLINKSYEPGTPSANYAKDMKSLINQMTEGQGGELYQEARRLRTKYGREFENVGYVDKLLRTKKDTTDRAVAFEDVFDHSILNGSLDDVRAIGMTLKKAGPEGQQAWKELQGQTIQYIKDQVTKNSDMDAFGNPVVSPAKFKSVVTTLDQDGKLDYVFGKKGAQEIRDLFETTMLVNKPLQGAANYSNSASAIITALDKVNETPLGKIPVLGQASKYIVKKGQESALQKKIQESINYDPMAEALRKGKK